LLGVSVGFTHRDHARERLFEVDLGGCDRLIMRRTTLVLTELPVARSRQQIHQAHMQTNPFPLDTGGRDALEFEAGIEELAQQILNPLRRDLAADFDPLAVLVARALRQSSRRMGRIATQFVPGADGDRDQLSTQGSPLFVASHISTVPGV